jgi:hypothetical protein
MPFKGVLISWLIVAKNSLFNLAASRALASLIANRAASLRIVTSLPTITTPELSGEWSNVNGAK